MTSHDQIRGRIAEIIAEEREVSTLDGSAQLAGLTEDEWTADRILNYLKAESEWPST